MHWQTLELIPFLHQGWNIQGFLILGMLLAAPGFFLMRLESSSDSYNSMGGGGGCDGGGE